MSAVSVNTISMRHTENEGYDNGSQIRVCGTCGCPVASERVARHVAWHGAAWGSPTVTADTSVTNAAGGS
jgi:hypothetical protein